MPIIIENDAAWRESWIVAEIALNINKILFYPPLVVGSITYHPQVPGGAEQLERNIAINKKIKIDFFIIWNITF